MENKNYTTSENEIDAQEKKSKPIVFVISLVVIVLLAAATFVGAQMLSKQAADSNDEVEITTAAGVPEENPELVGLVIKTDGDSLIVQEININDSLGVGDNGGVVVSEPIFIDGNPENDVLPGVVVPDFIEGSGGIQTEVIINQDTIIYKDVTEFPEIEFTNVGNGEMPDVPDMPDKIEQKVELGSIDDLGTTSFVTVWGEKRGDRVYAIVILYQPPMSFSIPGE